jgi:hypothetical protein
MSVKYDHQEEKKKFYVSLILTVLIYGSILLGITFINPFLVIFGVAVILFLIFYTIFIRLIDELIPPVKTE